MIVGVGPVLTGAVMFWVAASPSAARQLLSIEGVNLAPREFVSAFEIQTWDVRVLAVCRVPRGWSVSVSQDATAQGVLAGTAGQGVTYSDAYDVKLRFRHLFLTDDPHEILNKPRGGTPQTFNGRIKIGTYGRDAYRWQRLKPQNYALTPTTLCPDPDE